MALEYLRRRETFGCFQRKFGQESSIYSSLYSSIATLSSVGCDYGGIFNLGNYKLHYLLFIKDVTTIFICRILS